MSEIKVSFVEAEIFKVNLSPGDVLGIKIKSDDIDEMHLESLKKSLKGLFPNNKVMLFMLPTGDEMEFTAIQGVVEEKVDCSVKTCDDCSCGKAEKLQALTKMQELTEEMNLYKGDLE